MQASCFACEGTAPAVAGEAARRWIAPRVACATHAEGGQFAHGGPLRPVMQAPWPDGLEDWGANLLLNPLALDGRRAWLDVTSRGRAVVEEVFPSADYFEFAALHLSPFVDLLFEVHELARFAHREPLGMMAALAADNTRYTALQSLMALWYATRALGALVAHAGLGPPRSLEEAARTWREARPHLALAQPGPDHLRMFLMALLPLAGRRFAHLGGPWGRP
jgi:hypothetical protein